MRLEYHLMGGVCDGAHCLLCSSSFLFRIDSEFLDVQLHRRHFCAPPSTWEFAVCLNHALDYVMLLMDYDVYGPSTLVSDLLVRI